MILTTKQVSQGFHVTAKTVAEWVKRGMPKEGHGKFDFFKVCEWWAENIYRIDDTSNVVDAKEKYWQAKARREVVKADEAEGRVVDLQQVCDDFSAIGRTCRDAMLSIPDRIGAELASSTNTHVVTMKLAAAIIEALEEFSNRPEYIEEREATNGR
jgi:phage terminase Nu1 subunit (DNA packaging protein)